MAKVSPLQSDFSAGEISPLLYGRVDNDRYARALATCKNYVPIIQGALVRRPGTYYTAEVKDSTKQTRVVPFEFSVTQAYILEFGDQYIRFYRNNGQIESSPGTAYEISSPYLEAHLFQLKFTQSADVLYIAHPSYAPRKLSRTGHTSWTLTTIDLLDGPYFNPNVSPLYTNSQNITSLGLTPSAATGTGITVKTSRTNITNAANNGSGLIRITAASHGRTTGDTVGIDEVTGTTEANGSWTVTVIDANNFDLQGSTFANAYVSGGGMYTGLFRSTDVGRHIRMKQGSVWGWVKITAFNHYGSVTADVKSTLTSTAEKGTWRLGAFSGTTGYPAAVSFHEDRLWFGGPTESPQYLAGSRTGDYENFAPTDTDGTVTASHSVSTSLNSNDVNAIYWFVSEEKGLAIGTLGGEWILSAASTTEAITPVNIRAKRTSSWGSANIQAMQVGKASLFVQRAARKLREMAYFDGVNGHQALDISILAEHVTEGGITQLAYMKEPQSIVWAVRADGTLLGMTYERDIETVKAGWHRHVLGGYGDAANGQAVVESVAVIPSADGTRQELWLVVKRYIDGATQRYVEYMTQFFNDTVDQQDAFFVDCGLTLDNPLTITAITKANPAVVTSASHGLSNGDRVLLSEVLGMTELNNVVATVANVAANTFELSGINSTDYTTYVSGGEARKQVSTVSNLSHLEGQTVSVLADGAPQPDKVVSGGAVTLSSPASVVHVGLPYNSDGRLLRLEAGAQDGTALGKIRRAHRVGFLLHRTLGFKYGMDFDHLDDVTFRTSNEELTRAPALHTGVLSNLNLAADYDHENQICWRQSQPLPGTILAVMPQMATQDRG